MLKKKYIVPNISVVELELEGIIADSDGQDGESMTPTPGTWF